MAKAPLAPISLPSGITLRLKRAENPGKIAAPRFKRTTAEVQAEKDELDQKKADTAEARKTTIAKTAQLEADKLKQHQDNMTNAHNPPPNKQVKVLQSRSRKPESTKEFSINEDEVQDVSTDSGDSFKPDEVADEADDDDSEDDEPLDVSDEETVEKKKKKKKSKGDLRKEVASVLGDPTITEAKENQLKRKAVQTKEKNKKLRKVNAGLRPNWQGTSEANSNTSAATENESNDMQVDSNSPPTRLRSVSSDASMRSASSGMPSLTEDSSDQDLPAGISDDAGEEGERPMRSSDKVKISEFRTLAKTMPLSLAKVGPTTSVPSFIPPSKRTSVAHQRKKDSIRLRDLPPHLQGAFDSTFVPQLRQFLGCSVPWIQPSLGEIAQLWEESFLDEAMLVSGSWAEAVIAKLAEDRVTSWRHTFAKAATKFLQDGLLPHFKGSEEMIAQWCIWAISGPEHLKPFFYLSYKDAAEEGGKPVCVGLFQAPIISAVLNTHLSGLGKLNPYDREKRPVGALVLAIQVVKRAINMHTSGKEIKRGRPYDDFSKSNWGDHTEFREGGVEIKVKTTSNILALVRKLSDAQWEKIIKAAQAAGGKGKEKEDVEPTDVEQPGSPASSVEMVDDDEDLQAPQTN